MKEGDFGSAWAWFPVIGLGIGAILVGVHTIVLRLGDPLLAAAAVLAAWVAVTGALHLDGLGDCIDGLAGGTSREERLRIMADPHVGAMAVVAITTLLITKFALLAGLSRAPSAAALLLAPCLGRYTMVLLGTTLPAARPDGTAAPFVREACLLALVIATAVTAAACVVLRGISGAVGFVLIVGCGLGLRTLAARALGGITGDALGAAGELTEVIGLWALVWLP